MRGRVLILIGVVILVAIVLLGILMFGGGSKKEETTTTPGAAVASGGGGVSTPVPAVQEMVDIVLAIQDLPRGLEIPENGVMVRPWPLEALPEADNYFKDTKDVVGRIARTDIPRGAPVLRRQIVNNLSEIAKAGSDAAAILKPGLVAVAIPVDPVGIGQVAYGIRDGDYVDVIMSFLFIDVDETFQTRLPNNVSIITRMESGELSIGTPHQGRQEPSTLSPEGVLVGPSEQTQRPRLVTQRIIQNAFVVHVGYFPENGDFIGSTPTPLALTPIAPQPGVATPVPQVTPAWVATATPFAPVIITLGVTPQEALILTWAVDAQIPMTLALRAAGDVSITPTQSVTLQYMIENFQVTKPDTLPFALEPPITSVRQVNLGTLTKLYAEQTGIAQQ